MPFLTQGKTNWKYIIIVLIFTLIIGAGVISLINQQELLLFQLPEIEKPEKFTLEELKDAEYYVTAFEETVQLEDGYYFRPWLPDSATGLRVEILDNKIAFGDLSNDGKEDAAVIVYSSGGGTAGFRDLAVMINEDGKPSYLVSKFLGDRVMINSITIQSRVITLDMVVHGPKDGLCCPSIEKTFKYKLSDNQLVEVVEDGTADWKTYRNEEYGFEFKYPAVFDKFEDCKLREEDNIIGLGSRFSILVSDAEGLNLSEYVAKKKEELLREQKWPPPEESWHQENIRIGDIEGIKVFYTHGPRYSEMIYLLKDNKIFNIGYTAGISCLQYYVKTGLLSEEEIYFDAEIFGQIPFTFRSLE